MSSHLKNVTLIGGSGNLGAPILQALLDSGVFNVTVLTRQTSTAVFPSGATVRKTDYSRGDLETALKGQDAVISTVGPAGFLEQKTVIDAAVESGVKRYLPSEFSTNTLHPGVCELVPVFQTKKEILDYLQTKEQHGLTWTGLATGPLLDWGLQVGFLGFEVAPQKATIWDSGTTPFSATNFKTVCQAVVTILQRPELTANKYLYIASVKTSQAAILESFRKAAGNALEVKHVTTEEQVSLGRSLLAKGDFTGMLLLVQASMLGSMVGTDFGQEENLANRLLGLPTEESLDETVKAVIKQANLASGSAQS